MQKLITRFNFKIKKTKKNSIFQIYFKCILKIFTKKKKKTKNKKTN